MNTSNFLVVLSGVVINAFAQLLLKAGTQRLPSLKFSVQEAPETLFSVFTQPFILTGLTCYFVSALVWIAALSKLEVSIAYPMLSMGYVITTGLAWAVFGEVITAHKLVGTLLIMIGVVVLARG